MDKSLVGHAALAVVAVVAAYTAWQKPSASRHDPNVVVVSGSVDRLTKVEWDEANFQVTLDRHGDDLTITSAVKIPPDDKRNVTGFPVSEKGQELVGKLAPLKAERSLGKPEQGRLKEVGLEAPTQTLTLHFGDKVTKLDVGTATFGSGSYYVRDPNGEVFLLPAGTITPLKTGGPSLVERMVVNLTREHLEQVGISSEGVSRTLKQNNAGDRAHSEFVDLAAPADKLEKAPSWVDAVLRLRVLSAASETPATEPKLTVALRSDDGKERVVKVWEPAQETAVVTSPTFPKGVLVARSAVEMLLKDVKQVLADGKSSSPTDATAEVR